MDAANLYGNVDLELVREALLDLTKELTFWGGTLPWPHSYIKNLVEKANEAVWIDTGEEVIYHQIKGIAMGRADGPQIANWTIGYLERNLKKDYPERFSKFLLYTRYIDDVILIAIGDEGLENAKWLRDKLNERSGTDWSLNNAILSDTSSVIALDMQIHRSNENGKVYTKPYFKPTNLGLYIPPNSMHPKHIHKGWIRGELLRFTRSASYVTDFTTATKFFTTMVKARGHYPRFINEIVNNFNYEEERYKFITKCNTRKTPSLEEATKDRTREYDNNTIYIPIPYHYATQKSDIQNKIRNRQGITNSPTLRTKKIKVAWKRLRNLGAVVLDALNPTPDDRDLTLTLNPNHRSNPN
jgi:hypothetical protein